MTYEEALKYLDSLINYERTASFDYPGALKLDRMHALAKELRNPQNAYDSVIVAGSKGKGSTCAFLSSILRMENCRVGLYTSPHLVDLGERIQVNGLCVSQTRLAEYVTRLEKILENYAWRKNPPTYFEVLTAIAFWHFREMKVQIAVLEVGLGGLYDSTNIAEAKVVGLAPISLEHTDKLGKTVSKIAVQKCGVVKGREIVVSAPQVSEAETVIQKTVAQKDATLWRVGREIKVVDREFGQNFQRFDLRAHFGNTFNLETHLLGWHQLENAALAVGLAKAYEEKSRHKVSESAIRQGIFDTRWPARMEILHTKPLVVLDGAQNRDSVSRLIAAVKRHFCYDKLFLVFGALADKDVDGMLKELLPETEKVFVTRPPSPRAMEPREIADKIGEQNRSAEIVDHGPEALRRAKVSAGKGGLVLVTGSLYLAGEMYAQNSRS